MICPTLKAQGLNEFGDSSLDFLGGCSLPLEGKGDVFCYGECGNKVVGLENEANLVASVFRQEIFVFFGEVISEDDYFSAGGFVDAAYHVEEGCFSSS